MRGEWRELEARRQNTESWSGRIVALFSASMVAFLAWTQLFGKRNEELVSPMPVVEYPVAPEPVIERPQMVQPVVPLYQGPPPVRTGRESYVGIYECVVNGQRVVSDRPCGAGAQSRTLVIDQPDPREVVAQRQRTWQSQQQSGRIYSAPVTSGSRSLSGSAQPSNEAACESVDRAIDLLNARMRQRYSSAEGERLRAQWHALKKQRHDLRCGR
jgi:hypothetical protein